MPDFYEHELSSYKNEIESLNGQIESMKTKQPDKSFNLTHFSIGISNRANLMVVGLCSLVEMRLYELAEKVEVNHALKLSDQSLVRKKGLSRLEAYFEKTKAIALAKQVKSWNLFRNSLCVLRNVIIHEYGGRITSANSENVKNAVKALDIKNVFCTTRIRFDIESMRKTHALVAQVIAEVNKQAI